MKDTTTPSSEERTWALIAHAGAPAGLLLSAGLFGFAVPLVVWLSKGNESEFVAQHGKEALNFQITLFLVHLALGLFVLLTLGIGLVVALPFFFVLWCVELVLGIVAALRAHGGHPYRYPLTWRLIS